MAQAFTFRACSAEKRNFITQHPAASTAQCENLAKILFRLCSCFALAAGGTPAVPDKELEC